jgi:hypothetical protein
MIVQIKEYSRQTGIGSAVDAAGNKINFNYRQLKNLKPIPIGKKAALMGKQLLPVSNVNTIWFYICKIIKRITGGK